MTTQKIDFQGDLNMAIRVLETAANKFKNIYDDSQIRLPLADIEDINDKVTKAHKWLQDILITNKEFMKIAK